MKKCPICNVQLALADYEGVRVMQCMSCCGYLVPLQRLESIKRVDGKSWDELKEEASSQFKCDSLATLKCPRCHLNMQKKATNLPGVALHTDICRSCSLVWLDGGEIALLQLAYQSRGQFADARELKRRMAELDASPERKARFEEDLDKLPDPKDPVEEALSDIGRQLLSPWHRHWFRDILRFR